MLIRKGNLLVRMLAEDDKNLLAKWLSDPAVLRYYEGRDNAFDIEKIEQNFFCADEEMRCIVEYDNQSVGYVQFYQLGDEERLIYGYHDRTEVIFGMDQFLGETSDWNKGIGTQLVSAVVTYLLCEKGANRIVMDPQKSNERALRCYEKCGFKKVKLLPKRELHEGEFRDCWLIEIKESTECI